VALATAVDGKRPDDLVFSMPRGTAMRLSSYTDRLDEATTESDAAR
jgi:hypothetical protein